MFTAPRTITLVAASIMFALPAISSASAAPQKQFQRFGDGDQLRRVTISKRIANQRRRIRRNRRLRRLTWRETRRLRFALSHIRGFRAKYTADDWVSRREFRHVTRLLNRNSRRIRRLASNRARGWNRWRARSWNRRLPRHTLRSRLNGFH